MENSHASADALNLHDITSSYPSCGSHNRTLEQDYICGSQTGVRSGVMTQLAYLTNKKQNSVGFQVAASSALQNNLVHSQKSQCKDIVKDTEERHQSRTFLNMTSP
jgi:hypothetical protein